MNYNWIENIQFIEEIIDLYFLVQPPQPPTSVSILDVLDMLEDGDLPEDLLEVDLEVPEPEQPKLLCPFRG